MIHVAVWFLQLDDASSQGHALWSWSSCAGLMPAIRRHSLTQTCPLIHALVWCLLLEDACSHRHASSLPWRSRRHAYTQMRSDTWGSPRFMRLWLEDACWFMQQSNLATEADSCFCILKAKTSAEPELHISWAEHVGKIFKWCAERKKGPQAEALKPPLINQSVCIKSNCCHNWLDLSP
jgi:hypothetical protein